MKDEQFAAIVTMLTDIKQDQAQAKLALELHIQDGQQHPKQGGPVFGMKADAGTVIAVATLLLMFFQTWRLNPSGLIQRVETHQEAHK